MNDNLIEELKDWIKERGSSNSETFQAASYEVEEILSRHKPQENPSSHGAISLYEQMLSWQAGYSRRWDKDMAASFNIIMSIYKPQPKDCGFTLATCPYEREAGITRRKPQESLAMTAGKMGLGVEIYIRKHGARTTETAFVSDTDARAYLEGLEDHK